MWPYPLCLNLLLKYTSEDARMTSLHQLRLCKFISQERASKRCSLKRAYQISLLQKWYHMTVLMTNYLRLMLHVQTVREPPPRRKARGLFNVNFRCVHSPINGQLHLLRISAETNVRSRRCRFLIELVSPPNGIER